jgi:hypothetical protein
MQTATAKKGKTQIPGQFFIWIFSFFRVSFSRCLRSFSFEIEDGKCIYWGNLF